MAAAEGTAAGFADAVDGPSKEPSPRRSLLIAAAGAAPEVGPICIPPNIPPPPDAGAAAPVPVVVVPICIPPNIPAAPLPPPDAVASALISNSPINPPPKSISPPPPPPPPTVADDGCCGVGGAEVFDPIVPMILFAIALVLALPVLTNSCSRPTTEAKQVAMPGISLFTSAKMTCIVRSRVLSDSPAPSFTCNCSATWWQSSEVHLATKPASTSLGGATRTPAGVLISPTIRAT